MLALERPVLSLTIDALVNMSGEDALCGLLTLFLKCKDGLQDGDRLENMAKRLWHVERTSSRWCYPASSALSSPDLVVSSFASSSEHETDVSSEGETWNQDQATAVHEATGASNNEASSTLSKCLSPDPPAQPDRSERQSLKREKSNRRSPSPVSVSSRKTSPDRRPSLSRRRTHSNTSIGQIMADLLPDKLDLHRSASMNALLEQSTGHAESPPLGTTKECAPKVVVVPDVPLQQPQARPSPPTSGSFVRFPTVVIVNPTPHPTPPMTPQVSSPPTSPPTGPDVNIAPRCDTLTVMPHVASPGSPTLPPTPESMRAKESMEERTAIPLPGSKHSSRSQSLGSDRNSVHIKAVELGEITGKSASANSTSNLPKLGSIVPRCDPVPSGSSLNPPEKKFFISQVCSPDGDSPDTSASSQLGSQSGLTASVVTRPVVDKRADETGGVGEPASVASRSSAFTHSSNGSSCRGNGMRMKREKGSTGPSAMKGKGKAKAIRPGVYRTQSNTKIPRVPTGSGALAGSTIHRTKVGGRTAAASSGYHATLVPSQFAGQQTVRSGSNSGASVHPPPPAAVSKLVQEETFIEPPSSNPRPGYAARRSSSRRSSKSSGSGKRAKANDQALPSSSAKQRRLEFADDSDYSTDTEWDTEDVSEEADGTGGENDQALADRKLAEAAAEAQRQRDLFAKVDRRSYQDLARVRTQPGLLSAIFHPDPNLFPPDHPYRHSRSTQDILAHVNRPSYAPLQPSRATAAAPVAAPVTAQGVGSPTLSNARQRSPLRLKGPPQDVEESESGEEDESNKLHVSESVAEKRLAMLHQNIRGGRPHAPSRQPQQDPAPYEGRRPTNVPTAPTQAPIGFYGAPGAGPSLTRVATEPIPLGYPYNLPPPMPPSTPRTTRRNMLTHELSESLRRNLLWERQVSKQRPMGLGRRAVTNAPAPTAGPSRLRTSMTAAPNLNGQVSAPQDNKASNSEQAAKEKELREKRIRSWADDFHATGW